MEKVESRRIRLTKELLKNSLIELLETKDIYHISIRELCDNADVNRTTFYKYYGSQFDLLTDIENDLLKHINDAIEKNNNSRKNIIIDACHYLEDNLKMSRLLLNNNIDPHFPDKLFSMGLIKDSILKFTGKENDESLFEYLCVFQTQGIYHVIRTWLNKDVRETPEVLAKKIIDILS